MSHHVIATARGAAIVATCEHGKTVTLARFVEGHGVPLSLARASAVAWFVRYGYDTRPAPCLCAGVARGEIRTERRPFETRPRDLRRAA